MYVIGVDIGGTTVKMGIFQDQGNLVVKWEIPTNKEKRGERILPEIASSILKKCKEEDLPADQILGVGVGVPGPVVRNREALAAVNLYWGHKDVAGELEQALKLPVKVANDANVAALGEMWAGSGRGTENLIMVTLGTGVGGGIIVDGKIVAGAHGAGGEIGHGVIEPREQEACNCGNRGCLEEYASATGIVRLADRRLAADECPSLLRQGPVTAKAVFDAYQAGDGLAAEVVEQFADYLGRQLAAYACVTDPAAFILGGGVSKAGKALVDIVEKSYQNYAFPACRQARFLLAQLGNDAGIYGAARLAL